jgi:hypothetical protein
VKNFLLSAHFPTTLTKKYENDKKKVCRVSASRISIYDIRTLILHNIITKKLTTSSQSIQMKVFEEKLYQVHTEMNLRARICNNSPQGVVAFFLNGLTEVLSHYNKVPILVKFKARIRCFTILKLT